MGANEPQPDRTRQPLIATRVFTDVDGLSHAEQLTVNLSPLAALPGFEYSEPVKTARSFMVRVPPGYFHDFHTADVPRYVIPVSGHAEMEFSGGNKIGVEPGRVYIMQDLTGKGHTFRVAGDQDWVGVFVDFAQ